MDEKEQLYENLQGLRATAEENNELMLDLPEASQHRSYYAERFYEYMRKLFISAEQLIVAKPEPRMGGTGFSAYENARQISGASGSGENARRSDGASGSVAPVLSARAGSDGGMGARARSHGDLAQAPVPTQRQGLFGNVIGGIQQSLGFGQPAASSTPNVPVTQAATFPLTRRVIQPARTLASSQDHFQPIASTSAGHTFPPMPASSGAIRRTPISDLQHELMEIDRTLRAPPPLVPINPVSLRDGGYRPSAVPSIPANTGQGSNPASMRNVNFGGGLRIIPSVDRLSTNVITNQPPLMQHTQPLTQRGREHYAPTTGRPQQPAMGYQKRQRTDEHYETSNQYSYPQQQFSAAPTRNPRQPDMTEMMREIEQMRVQMNEMNQARLNQPPMAAGNNAMMGTFNDQNFITMWHREMQHQRHPTTISKFPSEEVPKKYWAWKCTFDCFISTNPHLEQNVIMHMLKQACEQTPAEGQVNQYAMGGDHYSVVIDALDRRFFIPRVVLGEFLEPIIQLAAPKGDRTQKENYYKEIIDRHQAFAQNLNIVCKFSLRAKGIPNPTREQLDAETINGFFIALLFRNMDDGLRTHVSTALHSRQLELPAYDDVLWAIERKYIASQGSSAATQQQTPHAKKSTPSATTHRVNAQITTPTNAATCAQTVTKPIKAEPRFCLICAGGHDTSWCPRLKEKKTWDEQMQVLKENRAKINICFICLEGAYGTCNCKSEKRSCAACGGRHHKVLCYKGAQASEAKAPAAKTSARRNRRPRKKEVLKN